MSEHQQQRQKQQIQSSFRQSIITNEELNPQHDPTQKPSGAQQPLMKEEAPRPVQKAERLMSLDAYRGLTVFGMILADQTLDIEGACWWLIHPKWNGLTFADLVFPSFLFIMGVAIPLAVSKSRPVKAKNVIRVFALFAIGLLLNIISDFDFPNLRILGILQRLSICYGINLFVHWATDYGTNMKKRVIAACFTLASVVVYIVLMLTWSDQSIGCQREHNLEPFCNFAGFIDRAVFTPEHIMEHTDPEGLISTITASFTTYVGYNFGLMVMKWKKEPEKLIKFWLAFAVVCGIFIYPCSLFMPFNKRLYTITFVFTNLCSCSIVLSLFMLTVDILPKKYPQARGKIMKAVQPMNWLGLNPLAVFILLQLVGDIMDGWISWGDDRTPMIALYDAVFSWMGNYVGTLVYTVFYGVVLTLAGGLLFRYKIFIRL